ncbi:MAG: SDR family oxidoreductase [Rhodocyclaceae bacterium]|nr:SDR family oxidoreductase [Rhodocyclaceae bacterium]
MNIDISGKTAVVCGASQGLGEASARMLASMGARVIAIARSEQMLSGVVTSLPRAAHQFLIRDFRNREEVELTAQQLSAIDIDILVNNAGGPPPGAAESAKADEYLEALQIHLLTSATLTSAVLPGMKSRGWGRIVNIVSVSGKSPVANLAVSNSVRGAIINWAKTLSNEVAAHGVTVNNVLPGYTRTSRLDFLNSNAAKRTGRSIEEVEAGIISQVPMERFGEPHEIAAAVAFFASPAASFITGTSLAADGGWSKYS